MINVLASSMVDLGQTKDYTLDMCCLSAKHTALRRKSKDWFDRNQDNVFEWGDMSIHGAMTIKIQLKACWSITKRTSSSSH